MKKNKDEMTPNGKWKFNDKVVRVFEDMLNRSIPQYDAMRSLCFNVGRRFVREKTDIIDLGCSRGEALQPFVEAFKELDVRFIGCDVSDPMLMACEKRFSKQIESGKAKFQKIDLRTDYPRCRSSLTLCILTMQFIPIEYRFRVLGDIYRHLNDGGALVMVEKILGNTFILDNLMVSIYYDLKKKNGYTDDQIQRKRLSLEGVLVPVTARWNEDMLRSVGFREIDVFWRWMNFCGWLAVK